MIRVSVQVLLLAFLFIYAEGANAAQKPPDVYGWEKLKWGMTGDEIKAAFGKDIKVHKPREDASEGVYSELELTGLTIGGEPFRASLWMGIGTKKLYEDSVRPEREPEGYAWAETFIKVEEDLVSKVRRPVHGGNVQRPRHLSRAEVGIPVNGHRIVLHADRRDRAAAARILGDREERRNSAVRGRCSCIRKLFPYMLAALPRGARSACGEARRTACSAPLSIKSASETDNADIMSVETTVPLVGA